MILAIANRASFSPACVFTNSQNTPTTPTYSPRLRPTVAATAKDGTGWTGRPVLHVETRAKPFPMERWWFYILSGEMHSPLSKVACVNISYTAFVRRYVPQSLGQLATAVLEAADLTQLARNRSLYLFHGTSRNHWSRVGSVPVFLQSCKNTLSRYE